MAEHINKRKRRFKKLKSARARADDEWSQLLTKESQSEDGSVVHYDAMQSLFDSGLICSSEESPPSDSLSSLSHNDNSGCCRRLYPSGFVKESKNMFNITWPIILTQVCQMILGPISLIFCGHLGSAIQLDGAALAISLINVTCIAVGQGMGSACDTFFSQTFGSSNKKLVGIYVQRSILIFSLAAMICFSIHLNTEELLLLIGQDPEVSKLAGQYMFIFIPGAYSFFMYIICSKYMQSQNIVLPNVFIGIFVNAVNALMHYLLIYQGNYETNGSAMALATAYLLMFILTLLYISLSGCCKDTWPGWRRECLYDWGKFVRLCLPGMLMMCLEWWGFEIGILLTGLLGTTELGAQSVLLQLDSIWFQIPLGIQIATAIRVGQYLGAGQIDEAKTVGRLAITLVVLLSIVAVIVFLVFQHQLPGLFTNVEEVIELTAKLLPFVAVYAFFDGVATACKGILYGSGRQVLGAVILFVSYYMLALPMGIPLMFLTSLRTSAYWLALAINLVVQAVILVTVVVRTDWQKQMEQAQGRAGMVVTEDITTKLIDASLPNGSTKDVIIENSMPKTEFLGITTSQTGIARLVWRRTAVFLIVLAILTVAVLNFLFSPNSWVNKNKDDVIIPDTKNETSANWLDHQDGLVAR